MLSGACTYASPTCFTIPAGYAIVKEGYSLDMREKLTSLRIENGFSQQELAERLNVTRQAISMWESGATIPSIDSLILLSKLYGVSVDEFLGLASEKKDEEAKAEAPANAGKSPRRLDDAPLDEPVNGSAPDEDSVATDTRLRRKPHWGWMAAALFALILAVIIAALALNNGGERNNEIINMDDIYNGAVEDIENLDALPWEEK